ncbi:MAG: hypothetical protein AAFR25_01680 [Cyanobacteria bacterium J06629_19]
MHILTSLKIGLKFGSGALVAAVLLSACHSTGASLSRVSQATVFGPGAIVSSPQLSSAQAKTESVQGDFVGGPTDCDGDGVADESGIDFDGDGVSDECVDGVEAIPEPPFQQTYTPTSEAFNSMIPAVGWDTSYQCGDGLYTVSLSRTAEDQLEYSSDGLTLTSEIVYDDLDPNLNQPLIIREPEEGIRYAFTQEEGGEFYEYAIADYSGQVGLYVYQTGEQIVAAPCVVAAN